MKTNKKLLSLLIATSCVGSMFAQSPAAHFSMTLAGNNITETVSGKSFTVQSQLPPCTVKGLAGDALLFDGWSNFISAALPSGINSEELTFTVLLAPQTYPMMKTDVAETTPTYGTICGNLAADGKSGMALQLSSQGDIQFAFGSAYGGGYGVTLKGNKKLPRGEWSRITAVYSKANNAVTLYLNGESIGNIKSNRYGINPSATAFMIGKDATESKLGPMVNLNTYVGLIDDIAIYNKTMTAEEVAAMNPSQAERPNFNYPASRYSEGKAALWRPQFHGMPSAGWTNESHGMTFSDNKWHVFFQKNANGPYMSRLHWGHISSENLYKWTEEVIAFGPDKNYDIKGCWSGCVFTDNVISGGKPAILYTAVDNAKATIALATPKADDLIDWNKLDNPIINGRPAGLSDDFRDPYFFTANGKQYIIVGTSKNGIGACTLHEYKNGAWTNTGDIFFQGTSQNQHGRFWEMPNITPMGDGKWLFTCTPLDIANGVHTICWVGTIGADGKFTPTSEMQNLEMGNISKDGYGLLSPTIFQKDGKTILLGIVPDKLSLETNCEMGWAHNYSLPRELTINSNGKILQQPYSGLIAMRTETTASATLTSASSASLAPVGGRQFEVDAYFTANAGTGAINFFKSGNRQAQLIYDATANTITLDVTSLDRTVNDHVYGGKYTTSLAERPVAGNLVNVHLYVDGSVVDIFVANQWAFSVRIFPNSADATGLEVETTGSVEANVNAWNLDANRDSGVESVKVNSNQESGDGRIFNVLGQQLSDAPKNGVYIVNGKKQYIKK